ncbi:MAG: hypothetical protein RL119_1575 [Actinomycetota bacterium]
MSRPEKSLSSSPERAESASVSEVFDLVKNYAKQETWSPLKGAGRWLALGTAGSIFLGLGLCFILLGLLRLLQTETDAFDGGFSWIPYLLVLVVSLIFAGISLARVKKATLGKEPS